jgi:NAD-dependent dihydropyrimidine dehydrogenase PreA subunit
MIELVSTEACTQCNICVQICPMNVFDRVVGGAPVAARQDDCQTCFMCELYCPEDALYVSPDTSAHPAADEGTPAKSPVLGSYRAAIGWSKPARQNRGVDLSYKLLPPT